MSKSILVVDDEPGKSLPLVEHLKQAGYAVTFCESGTQALALIEAQRPDIVICDLEMPDMSGYQVMEVMATRLNLRDTPFLLTNEIWTRENWSREAGGRTADCHVAKPIDVREVTAFTRRILQSVEEDNV